MKAEEIEKHISKHPTWYNDLEKEYMRETRHLVSHRTEYTGWIESRLQQQREENERLMEIIKKGVIYTDDDYGTLTIHWDKLSDEQGDLISEISNPKQKR